jgi:hypothetical protein
MQNLQSKIEKINWENFTGKMNSSEQDILSIIFYDALS